jgi:hypothetical protein
MTDFKIIPKSLTKHLKQNEWALDMFYTNFEIAKFSFFRSKNYMSYYNSLDQTGNIYYRRWGDAPIHWLGVHMFLPDTSIWCIKDITYQHGSWVRNISSFSSPLSAVTIPEPYRTQFVNEFTKSLNFTIDT